MPTICGQKTPMKSWCYKYIRGRLTSSFVEDWTCNQCLDNYKRAILKEHKIATKLSKKERSYA